MLSVQLGMPQLPPPPFQYSGRKGSLLTTLPDMVHERIENSGGYAEQQSGCPGVISKGQEITSYLSEPVLPVRSSDGKSNLEELMNGRHLLT